MKSDDELKLDDPDEPNIEGNDDDFSDLSSVDSEEQIKAFQSCSSSIHPADLIAASSPEVFTPFPNLMKTITNESNGYAKQVMGDEKFAKRKRMTVEALKGFLRFHIVMVVNHLPQRMTTGDKIHCCILVWLLIRSHMNAIMTSSVC